MCKKFPIYLDTSAQFWFKNCCKEDQSSSGNWYRIQTAMLPRFRPFDYVDNFRRQLHQRRVQEGETVNEYVDDVLYLAANVNSKMDDKEIVRHLLRSLRGDMSEKVALMTFRWPGQARTQKQLPVVSRLC